MERAYTFDWRRREHARVAELLVRERFLRGPLRILWWAVWVVVVPAGLIAVAGMTAGDIEMVIPLLPLAIAVAILTLGFSRTTGWLQAWQIGRSDPNIAYPITFRFVDSGLQVSMQTVEAELRWSGVPRVRETADFFLVHYSFKRAYFLPKRAIPAREEVADLADWIRARLPESAEYVKDP